MTPLLGLYRAATSLVPLATGAYLGRRLRRGKEDASRLGERRGLADRPRSTGPLVWMHGASVGEALALLPLVERLIERGTAVLVTTGTLTSARLLAGRLPPGALHQFVPLDVPLYVRRFLDHWQPGLVLLAESELWPNMVLEVTRRGVPLVQVNARLSQRSFDRWRRLPGVIAPLLAQMTASLAQSEADAERLRALGAVAVQVTGNLKFDGPPPTADAAGLQALADRIGLRPLWLAASTHRDEEALILDTHRRLRLNWPDLMTIVVPRQPNRGAALAQRAVGGGIVARLRSRGEAPDATTGLYVADTIGELGLFYRLAPVVFVGKTLGGFGGQNPIEPAKLGCAILHGPHVANFTDVYRLLDEAGGALMVADGAALAEAVGRLLADPAAQGILGEAARDAMDRQGGATDRTLASIEPLLARIATPLVPI